MKDTFSFFDGFNLTIMKLQEMTKGKAPPAKRAKKGSVKQSSANDSSQTKDLSMLIAMPLDILLEVKNPTSQISWMPTLTHDRCWNSLDLLKPRSPQPHQPVQNKPNVAGYSHDKECHLCLEGGKAAHRGTGVPLEHERTPLGCPSLRRYL